MFLVSSRSRLDATQEDGNQIELTQLADGQRININLAAGQPGSQEVQLLCRVAGSQPAAKIEWRRLEAARGDQLLVSEEAAQTNRLLESSAQANGRNERLVQWSSLRVSNIGLGQHESRLQCSAANELYNSFRPSNPIKLSTAVRLSITHVPQLQLRLASIGNRKFAGDGQGEQPVALAAGQNVSLECLVSWANPPLLGHIEWLVGPTKVSPEQTKPIRVLHRLARNSSQAGETIVFQLAEGQQEADPLADWQRPLEVACEARNLAGQSRSAPVRFVVGRPPSCEANGYLNTLNANVNAPNEPLTDKAPSVYCPVISDLKSSKFYFKLNSTNGSQILLASSSSNTIPISKLISIQNPSIGQQEQEQGKEQQQQQQQQLENGQSQLFANNLNFLQDQNLLTCYASDKFGSNERSSCSIRVQFEGK